MSKPKLYKERPPERPGFTIVTRSNPNFIDPKTGRFEATYYYQKNKPARSRVPTSDGSGRGEE